MNEEIDFESLSLKDALDLAVLIEEEARDRYVELAGQMRIHDSAAAARFFETMARMEEGHREHLLQQRHKLYGDSKVRVTRQMFSDVEAPRIDDARVKLSRDQALGEALKAEEKAQLFFEQLLTKVKNPNVGRLFALLRSEEVEHRRLVLEQMSRSAEKAARPRPQLRIVGP